MKIIENIQMQSLMGQIKTFLAKSPNVSIRTIMVGQKQNFGLAASMNLFGIERNHRKSLIVFFKGF